MPADQFDNIRAVTWDGERLGLLDQRLLPHTNTINYYTDVQAIAQAITDMVVRGAPAIGVTAAYGVVIAAKNRIAENERDWKQTIKADLDILAASRPTAVNLFWALDKMSALIEALEADPVPALDQLARQIHTEDIDANRKMGQMGAELISQNSGILTHCNTGSLATGGYGTALGVIRSAYAAEKVSQVFADETRPWLQGARLTAWELVEDNIPVTLIAEGAAAHLMKSGKVQWVIVGSDRIAANGDVANKIGTYALAVLARHHGVKFMVVAPSSTVDMAISHGDDIPIELRSPEEVLSLAGQRVAAPGAAAWNPAFDVTPADLVDAIVTERGVVNNPNLAKMKAMMA